MQPHSQALTAVSRTSKIRSESLGTRIEVGDEVTTEPLAVEHQLDSFLARVLMNVIICNNLHVTAKKSSPVFIAEHA